ncbi:WD40-repeat-containing domain protein [Naematelia encephala]|uniref:WD40-repeat-containing domain protein n=1 Tax=Naematelia encephala TaxID=71784 RepID=A0A1Y2AIL0_9TREE|nr:WD40-repeat-containing domain protein [Naematelia encephala]
MSDSRTPLSSLPTNTPFSFATPAAPKKLAPIFTALSSRSVSTPTYHRTAHCSSSSSSSHIDIPTSSPENIQTPTRDSSSARKRVRITATASASSDILDSCRFSDDDDSSRIHNYFVNAPYNGDGYSFERPKEVVRVPESSKVAVGGEWRRSRRRLGIGMSTGPSGLIGSRTHAIEQEPCQLENYVTSLRGGISPTDLPSTILLPSIHSPTGRPRDFAPALSVVFSNTAKQHDACSARENGTRRMVAIGGEEGGVRILDVDDGLGHHPEERGWWWRAHTNAIFDVKWSSDDSRILTASGDQTSRVHSLTSPTPTLLATLRGHTSSIKTAVFFDPSRSHSDPSNSSIVASAGRDGNILVFDLRCRGRQLRDSAAAPTRRSVRYASGVPGWAPQGDGQVLDPVMSIRNAHGDATKRSAGSRSALKSVTSLIALQSMPGMLASGGNSNGIVKLWDLRFPEATSRSPDPRPSCTAYGVLPDPTIQGSSTRARSLNAMTECPLTGDLYVACGDSRIHTLRPSAANTDDTSPPLPEAIQPRVFANPDFLIRTFYVRLAVSPDGRYLACGNSHDGIMTFDTRDGKGVKVGLGYGGYGREREVSAVDWGKDLLVACADDLATRVYRPNMEARELMRRDPYKAGSEWAGAAQGLMC